MSSDNRGVWSLLKTEEMVGLDRWGVDLDSICSNLGTFTRATHPGNGLLFY